jgi:hypothetical protein
MFVHNNIELKDFMLNQKKQNYKCPDNKMNHLNNVDEFKIIIVFLCVSSQIFIKLFC